MSGQIKEAFKTFVIESESEMSLERKAFDHELEAVRREIGQEAVTRAYLVFAKALYWLRLWGHGNLMLSAVSHMFGLKIRADTVFSINDTKE